jgi:hypothetical protein
MERMQRKAFQRFGVLAIVLSGHVLLAMLLSSSRPSDSRKGAASTEPESALVLLDLESRVERPPLEQRPETPRAASASRTHAVRPRKSSKAAPSEPSGEVSQSTAIGSGKSGVVPKIDWYGEMETTLETVAPKMIQEYVDRCAQAERAHARRPPGCNRRSFDGPWRPTGNWALDMRDPDRPHSSVPEPLPEAFPKAPRSVVIQDEK